MKLLDEANMCLSKAYLEGDDYGIEDLCRIFGQLECLLNDFDGSDEANLAHECAALGYWLLYDPKFHDMEVIKEHAAALFRGLARYDALDA